MGISQAFRRTARTRAILQVFASEGLYFVLAAVLPRFRGKTDRTDGRTRGQRLEAALCRLGPTFVKLGQFLSTRHDLVPSDLREALGSLQDHVPAVPFSEIRRRVEEELGGPLEQWFTEFSVEPLAAASIGQAHAATLQDGTEVVVKVRRPAIEEVVRLDLEILERLARMLDRGSWGSIYRFSEMATEFRRSLLDELDYRREAQYTQMAASGSALPEYVAVPRVFSELSSQGVLTLERLRGLKPDEPQALAAAGLHPRRLATRLTRTFYRQVLLDGFFHADLHPGNVLVGPGNRLLLLDFGMVGFLEPTVRRFTVLLVGAFLRQDPEGMVAAMQEMGMLPRRIDREGLRQELFRLTRKYHGQQVRSFRFGDVFSDLLDLGTRYGIRLPRSYALLTKGMLTVEAVAYKLAPLLDLSAVARPVMLDLYRRSLSPGRLPAEALQMGLAYGEWMQELPVRGASLLRNLAEGRFRVHTEMETLPEVLTGLDRVGRRLATALLSAGLLLSTAILAARSGTGALMGSGNIPLATAAYAATVVAALWLLLYWGSRGPL